MTQAQDVCWWKQNPNQYQRANLSSRLQSQMASHAYLLRLYPSPRNNVIVDTLWTICFFLLWMGTSVYTHRHIECVQKKFLSRKKKGRWADVGWLFSFSSFEWKVVVLAWLQCMCKELTTLIHVHTYRLLYYPIFITVWILIPPKKKKERRNAFVFQSMGLCLASETRVFSPTFFGAQQQHAHSLTAIDRVNNNKAHPTRMQISYLFPLRFQFEQFS